MLWTVAVIADSAEAFYETFVGCLDDAEKDALWQDYLLLGELFGMPREAAPGTYRGFRDYWEEMWSGDELHLTPEAREVALAIAFEIPLPLYLHPQRELHNLVLTGTLPARVRELFGLRWTLLHEAAFGAIVRGARAGRPLAPRRLREGQNTGSFELVAATEKRLVAEGKATLPSAPLAA
jgi:uncharacterized protein (DUF2236 family)